MLTTMVAVVSVTGVFLAAHASDLEGMAGGRDRQAVLESVRQKLIEVRVETQVRREQLAFARYRGEITVAEELESAAQASRQAGRDQEAMATEDAARQNRKAAETLLSGLSLDPRYLEGEGSGATYGEERRRNDLRRTFEREPPSPGPPPDPDRTARTADALRRRAVAAVGWIMGLAGAAAVLTAARYATAGRRLIMTSGAVVVYAVATIAGLGS